MHTYLISDLHLSPERPDIANAFGQFMMNQAHTAERLYILGDLFEYWIGDDAANMIGAEPTLNLMHSVSQHTECAFIAGNRDFLVREQFAERTGFKILDDETVVDLYGTPTLLLHGDSLCTDDVEHQKFRATMMTNRLFCDQFLALTIPERIEQAKQARLESGKHKSQISEGIMDVTLSSVEETFAQHNVKQMIHGHTHRQNKHQHLGGVRHVLGDWDQTSSIMSVSEAGLKIENATI